MTTRRLTVDAVLKMATAAAQKHVDASPGDRKANADMSAAIAATWELVKGRLGSSESANLDGLITKLVGSPNRARPESSSN
jgi:hypothetical protein